MKINPATERDVSYRSILCDSKLMATGDAHFWEIRLSRLSDVRGITTARKSCQYSVPKRIPRFIIYISYIYIIYIYVYSCYAGIIIRNSDDKKNKSYLKPPASSWYQGGNPSLGMAWPGYYPGVSFKKTYGNPWLFPVQWIGLRENVQEPQYNNIAQYNT